VIPVSGFFRGSFFTLILAEATRRHIPYISRLMKGQVLKNFALLAFVCTVLLSLCLQRASAQHGDVMAGASELDSATKPSDVVTFQPLQEKNGIYGNIAADFFSAKYPIGLNLETSWRYHQGDYYGYEKYRPFFTAVNAVYQMKVTKRIGVDVFGGIGVASNRFDLIAACNIPGCTNYTSSNHFMEDLGFGVRYRFWRRFFVRPEVNYYHIHNNQGFNSDNVFRGGVSIGYAWGTKPAPSPAANPAPKSPQ
jgi:opacity protein-like surface antigen